jgi:hypothetical protein
MTLAACSNGDALLESTHSTFPSTTQTTPGENTTSTLVPTSTAPTTTLPTTTTTADRSIAAGSELVVNFAYEAISQFGFINNPYVAVWIEDAQGDLVQTLSVWWLVSQKGTRFLPQLRRWVHVDGTVDTLKAVSGATRTPGQYSLAWDGTNLDGDMVDKGTYYINIESAREHGYYSLIREPIDLEDSSLTVQLPSNGELTSATATFDAS